MLFCGVAEISPAPRAAAARARTHSTDTISSTILHLPWYSVFGDVFVLLCTLRSPSNPRQYVQIDVEGMDNDIVQSLPLGEKIGESMFGNFGIILGPFLPCLTQLHATRHLTMGVLYLVPMLAGC